MYKITAKKVRFIGFYMQFLRNLSDVRQDTCAVSWMKLKCMGILHVTAAEKFVQIAVECQYVCVSKNVYSCLIHVNESLGPRKLSQFS